jgi:tol-pal system protein YbgF
MRSGVPTRLLAHAVACSFALMTGLVGLGCAHADSAADRHFAELRDAVGKVEAEQDRENRRLEAFESAGEKAPPPPKSSPAPATPVPRTVQIGGDDDAAVSDDPNDPTARPEIRLHGQAGAAPRPLRGKTTRGKGEARIEPASEGEASDASRPSVLDPDAKRSYEDALSLVNSKQYDRALEALGGFLNRWPDHPYVENALYWRGEVYFARGEHLRAAEQLEAVVARGGNKAPDALLKIGMCHERLGASDRAKEYWDHLRRDYPRSDAAKKIPQSSERSRGRGVGPKENR